MNKKIKSELLGLMNVGQAVLRDLHLLGIYTIEQLAHQSPDHLYYKLQQLTGTKQNPCVWDVLAAIIHEARTGEKMPWWFMTSLRKSKKSILKIK